VLLEHLQERRWAIGGHQIRKEQLRKKVGTAHW